MPWQFNNAQLTRIEGRNQPMPAQHAEVLNACSPELQEFFTERQAVTVLSGSGAQLAGRLAALEDVVASINAVNAPNPRFANPNVSSMLGDSRGHFVNIANGIIALVTPPPEGEGSQLTVLAHAGFAPRNVSGVLHGAKGQFLPIVAGLLDLVTPREALGWQSPLQVLNAAGLSTDNVASILHRAGGNYAQLLQRLVQFVTPPATGGPSTFAYITGAGMTANQVAHILDGAGETFDGLVQNLIQFVTPPAQGGASTFQQLRTHLGVSDIAGALGGAGNRFSNLVAELRQHIADGTSAPRRKLRNTPLPEKYRASRASTPSSLFLRYNRKRSAGRGFPLRRHGRRCHGRRSEVERCGTPSLRKTCRPYPVCRMESGRWEMARGDNARRIEHCP